MIRLLLLSTLLALVTSSCHSLAFRGAASAAGRGAARSTLSQAAKRGLKNQKKPKTGDNQLKRLNQAGDLVDLLGNGTTEGGQDRRIKTAAEIDRDLRARGIDTRGFRYGAPSGTGARMIYGTRDRSPTGATMDYPNP